ncbi:MAG: hypothetical protein K8R77_11850 [Anaerolineaceae bacterium]|nr:hypothetical protein [Anaerolineaceae bacterium]
MSDDKKETTATKKDPVAEEKFKPLTEDPYTYDACVVSASIHWMPEDGDSAGRQMVISVRNHLDQPMMRFYRENELPFEQILNVVDAMLQELQADMPNRKMAKLKAVADKKKRKKRPAPVSTSTQAQGTVISTSTPFEITRNGKKKPITAGQQSLF